ncbi:MAG: AAA family ATPase [Saprospiraceae bacterium]
MPEIQLNIPVLVRRAEHEKKTSFTVVPVFMPVPVVTNKSYRQALSDFKSQFRQIYQTQQHSADKYLWLTFSPELQHEVERYHFKVGKVAVNGPFSFIKFKVQDKSFVCLPAFNQYIYLEDSDSDRNDKRAEKILKFLINEYASFEEEDFLIDNYYASKKEGLVKIPISLKIKNLPFSIEAPGEEGFFAAIRSEKQFDGAGEMEKIGTDLNQLFPYDIERGWEIEEAVAFLKTNIYSGQNSPLVILGETGSGRHTLIREVVYSYLEKMSEKQRWQAKRIWLLDPVRVIAGMSIVGHWEKRFEAILEFLQGTKEDAPGILLIDNPVALFKVGKSASGNLTLGDVLKEYLLKRKIQVVLLATSEEWKIVQEADRSFTDLCHIYRHNAPEHDSFLRILLNKRKSLEELYQCKFTVQALEKSIELHRQYFPSHALPGGVVSIINRLAKQHQFGLIDVPEVLEGFNRVSGLKDFMHDRHVTLEKESIRESIESALIGQPEAAQALIDTATLLKSNIQSKEKPITSFLFIGPTGVGKTQAAKVLSKYLSDKDNWLIRFDMNEYIDDDAVNRLVGNALNPEGLLTSKVRYQPFGVLLLDEIEKANYRVLDLLLQILDDGRLTDGAGRTVDFSNTIIIMTSNLGSVDATQQLGFGAESRNLSPIYQKAIKNYFRPEFINRIDKVVMFQPLNLEQIQKIARLQINELLQREGFVRRTTILNIPSNVLEWVSERGFDPKMGGRSLKRQIEKDLTALSAEALIQTSTSNPIIFEIYLENGVLKPGITVLDFAEQLPESWVPELPDETQGKRFLAGLLKKLVQLEDLIQKHTSEEEDRTVSLEEGEEDNVDWQTYDLKRRLQESKERIQTLMLGFGDRFFKKAPTLPLRLKKASLNTESWDDKSYKVRLKDRLFQKEGLEELLDQYQFTSELFDSLETELLFNWLETELLEIYMDGFLNGHPDKIRLEFSSSILEQGEKEIQYLVDIYSDLINQMDLHFVKGKSSISLEGFGLKELFKSETGFHLFNYGQKSIIPIKMNLTDAKNEEIIAGNDIIRIYEDRVITDLKTGLATPFNISNQELKLIVLGGTGKSIENQVRW